MEYAFILTIIILFLFAADAVLDRLFRLLEADKRRDDDDRPHQGWDE